MTAETAGPSRGRLYDCGYTPEQRASVAELLTDHNAVAQISELPDRDGFLIRVWPPGGTNEFGGTNLACLTAVIRFDADHNTVIEKLEALAGARLGGTRRV